ncbi:MAG: hypothetical protein ACTHJ8_07225 [Mucilaginibacter sp.]|jgi:hypothetical protein
MYKLVRHISTLLVLLVIGFKSFGQSRPEIHRPPNYEQRVIKRQSRVEQVRENYISRRLALTPEQSERFWPVYRRYQDALTAVRVKKRMNNSNTQADGTEQIQMELYYESELVNIRKFYTNEFLKILPPEKVSELFKAEREFTDELIRQLRERSGRTVNNPN